MINETQEVTAPLSGRLPNAIATYSPAMTGSGQNPVRLYVWLDKTIAYGGAVLVATGLDIEDARRNALQARNISFGRVDSGEPDCSFGELAAEEPSLILDAPAAVYHMECE